MNYSVHDFYVVAFGRAVLLARGREDVDEIITHQSDAKGGVTVEGPFTYFEAMHIMRRVSP